MTATDAGGVDVVILDGEAQPTGGMGVSRQIKDEIDDCPPVILVSPGRTTAGWPPGRGPTPCWSTRSTR